MSPLGIRAMCVCELVNKLNADKQQDLRWVMGVLKGVCVCVCVCELVNKLNADKQQDLGWVMGAL